MDKPNSLIITGSSIMLSTPRGQQAGTWSNGTLRIGGKVFVFTDAVTDEIRAAIEAYRPATVVTLRGQELYDAIARGERVYDRRTEHDAYEAGKVRTSEGTGPIVVRFAKTDLVSVL